MNRTVSLMMALIQSEIDVVPFDAEKFAPITEEDLKVLYSLSSIHTLDHIIGCALKKNHFLTNSDASKQFQKKILLSVLQYEKMNATLEQISKVLNQEKIAFLPLKGSRIRKFYPEPYLRNSCDIDILVHENDLDSAVKVLHQQLNFEVGEKAYHDISLYSKNGVHLELHFNIQENMENIDKLLKRVWDYSEPISNESYEYAQTNEYFMFHQIAHITYHFANGGCGIRMFMDIYVLRKSLEYDEKVLEELCAECGILDFYHHILELVSVWFENKEHNETTQMMENYILNSGIYGTRENSIAVGQLKSGSKKKYILQRIFMPYESLKILYPKVEQRKWLMPFYEICRWCRTIFKGRLKSSVDSLKVSQNLDESRGNDIQNLLNQVGL